VTRTLATEIRSVNSRYSLTLDSKRRTWAGGERDETGSSRDGADRPGLAFRLGTSPCRASGPDALTRAVTAATLAVEGRLPVG
jgi:hypothetical protein